MTESPYHRFVALHRTGRLVLPNPWDAGSAKILAAVGFTALATTSGGFAASLGRLDGKVDRSEALTHAAAVVASTSLPVSADLENAFAHDPLGVAETIGLACAVGLAGGSVEDYTGDASNPIYDIGLATERIAAAAEVARGRFVLTARAENLLHGRDDLDDTVARLTRYAAAGADVVYAPGLKSAADIARVLDAVDLPVNVLLLPGGLSINELFGLGVARVSTGGALSMAVLGRLADLGTQLLSGAPYDGWEDAARGRQIVRTTFSGRT